jgi:hypothetical protein
MSQHNIILSENAEKSIKVIQDWMKSRQEMNFIIESCIAFSLFMISCAEENQLFKENINNVMQTNDFKNFFTGENEIHETTETSVN